MLRVKKRLMSAAMAVLVAATTVPGPDLAVYAQEKTENSTQENLAQVVPISSDSTGEIWQESEGQGESGAVVDEEAQKKEESQEEAQKEEESQEEAQKEEESQAEAQKEEEKQEGNVILEEADGNGETLQDGEYSGDVDLSDQEELDRALEEGLVEFKPNPGSESYARAGAVSGADVVGVAAQEVGTAGRPNKYTYWLGTIGGTYSYAWCHVFVSWCGAQAGAGDLIPRTASCYSGVQEFKSRGQWKDRITGYVPQAGDIIYFDWDANGGYDHVGIVDYVSGGYVHTIEGNASDAVRYDGGRTGGYALTDSQIIGYGTPSYTSASEAQGCLDSLSGDVNCVKVRGWAFDRTNLEKALKIQVYVGGTAGSGASKYVVKANKSRPDVEAAYPGVGEKHGFDSTITVSETGSQPVYVYAVGADENSTRHLLGSGTVTIQPDTQSPVVSGVEVSNVSVEGYTVTCQVSDNVGVTKVLFPSWHESQTGDQALWLEGTVKDGVAECYIPVEKLGNQSGTYTTHVYAYDAAGNYGAAAAKGVTIDFTSLSQYNVKNISSDFEALIQSESNGNVLSWQEDTGTVVCSASTGADDQVWIFKQSEEGIYAIQSKSGSQYLSVSGADSGTSTLLSVGTQEDGQLWQVYQAGEDSYYISPMDSEDQVLTLSEDTGSGDATLTLETFGAAAGQCFKIKKLTTNIQSIQLDKTELNFTALGTSQAIAATVEPQSAADEKICWSSSNEKVVKVGQNGLATSVGNGTAKITASTENGSITATCEVTVAVKVTKVELNKEKLTLTSKGATKKLSAAISPKKAYNQSVSWSSSNTKVAKVGKSGIVKAVGNGTATVKVKTEDGGKTASCKVTVSIPEVAAGGKIKKGNYTYTADFIPISSGYKTYIYRKKEGKSKVKLTQVGAKAYIKRVSKGKLYYEKVMGGGKRKLYTLDLTTLRKSSVS